jgi:hypothetical protein
MIWSWVMAPSIEALDECCAKLIAALDSKEAEHIVEGWDGCAVGVHDRQDNRVGKASVQAKAVSKAKTTPKTTCKLDRIRRDLGRPAAVCQSVY